MLTREVYIYMICNIVNQMLVLDEMRIRSLDFTQYNTQLELECGVAVPGWTRAIYGLDSSRLSQRTLNAARGQVVMAVKVMMI